jgi:hypothetical protein
VRVKIGTRCNDFHVDATLERFEQGLDGQVIRNQIGIRDPDAIASRGDRYQQH